MFVCVRRHRGAVEAQEKVSHVARGAEKERACLVVLADRDPNVLERMGRVYL